MREGWESVTLGDIAHIQQGKRVDHLPIGDEQFPVLGATEIIGSWSSSSYSEPVIAMGCRGTVGRVRLISEPSWFGNNVMAVFPKESEKLSTSYLGLALSNTNLEKQGAIGGQVQKQITRKSLFPVKVNIAPLHEQERIVDLMDSVDAAISAAQAEVDAARELRERVLGHELGSPGEGWESVTLGDIAHIQQGKRVDHLPIGDEQFPVLGATEIIGSWSSSSYSEPVIAMGCRGTVGRVRLISEPSWFGNNVMAVFPKESEKLSTSYLGLALSNTNLEKQGAIGGQVQKQITRKSLFPVKVNIAPLHEQERIVETMNTIDETVEASRASLYRLRELRSSMLSVLLSGEHEIPATYDQFLELSDDERAG